PVAANLTPASSENECAVRANTGRPRNGFSKFTASAWGSTSVLSALNKGSSVKHFAGFLRRANSSPEASKFLLPATPLIVVQVRPWLIYTGAPLKEEAAFSS